MSTAWAGGTDAIIERMKQMTALFIEEQRKAIACKYCLSCQTALETGKI